MKRDRIPTKKGSRAMFVLVRIALVTDAVIMLLCFPNCIFTVINAMRIV